MVKVRDIKSNLNMWTILSLLATLLILTPNLNIILNLFTPANENWQHIKTYLLSDYIANTITLIIFTGILSIGIGTSLAWLISLYDFPFRKFFKWGLILPLAIPPYIAAYTYNGILNYTGVLQTFLRNSLEIRVNPKYFDIMSINGAIFIFTLVLFPYVYTITQSFMEKQASSLIENARLLGRNSFEIFLSILLPLSRTAIIGGASLVILEVLNDYGVVSYFGIPTISTAIFSTWFAMSDLDSAIKLASSLMLLVFFILAMEKFLRGKKRFSFSSSKIRPISLRKLKGVKAALAFSYCLLIFGLGFLVPAIQLAAWAMLTYSKVLNPSFAEIITTSVLVALTTAALIIIIALVIANYSRITEGFLGKLYAKITVIGYSIPGAVIAIGVLVFFIGLDNSLYWFYNLINEQTSRLVLSSSVAMLIFAYIIRFIAIGFNSVDSGFDKIGKKFFEASRTLGMSVTQTFVKVDLIMLKPALLSGFILVFVDVLKELPLTLILRPFNFNTLATKAYQYANDEMIHEAAIPSLIIILISTLSIYFFQKVLNKEELSKN